MAISALEHIDSENSFVNKLTEIKNGLKNGGIACLVINSDIKEINPETKESLEAQFEVNLTAKKVQSYLRDAFFDWHIIKSCVKAQEYDIPRGKVNSHLYTNVVTYVVRKTL